MLLRLFIAVNTRCSANFGTDYDIITDFLNLDFCSEQFISIKH